MKLVESILRTAVAVVVVAASVYLLDKFGLVEFVVSNVDVALTKLNPPK
jgi:hypothetical protein